jgi:uncharacterized protein (TIGR03435 family)
MRFLPIVSLAAIIAVIGMLDPPRSLAQSLQTDPAFEVTAIKPNLTCGGPGRGSGGVTSPGRMTLECAELRDLILTAYGIYANGGSPGFRMQVLGGPGWIDSDRYDIAAKAEGNPPVTLMYGPMLRALLEDRFKLKVHRETKQAPVYLLTTVKGGAKLKPGKEGSGSQVISREGTFDMYGATMASLSIQLGIRLDREVIDKTGITGMFDIHLEVSRADLAVRAVAGGEEVRPVATDSTGPSIFTALQQQLGLKLESAQGPVEFLAIDHIEKPSKN